MIYLLLGILWVGLALSLFKFILSFNNTEGEYFKIGLLLIPVSFAVGLMILAIGLIYY
ncbi:MAG: hypothetical protein H0X62_03695 [Bacteroidetes bacterium]|nr:hypothetical protein [Bacteroidota bacterium]